MLKKWKVLLAIKHYGGKSDSYVAVLLLGFCYVTYSQISFFLAHLHVSAAWCFLNTKYSKRKGVTLMRCCAHIHKRQKWHCLLVTVPSRVRGKTHSSSRSSSGRNVLGRGRDGSQPLLDHNGWQQSLPFLFCDGMYPSCPHSNGDPHPAFSLTHFHEKSSTSPRLLWKGGRVRPPWFVSKTWKSEYA